MPKKTIPFALREVTRINAELDRYPRLTTLDRLCHISDRVVWLRKFHKAPLDICDALIVKITALFEGSWYGDEPEQTIIENYVKGV